MFTLGTAARHVGKSKPTISKAIKDGKLSATKVAGVYQIEPSELLRVFPARSTTDTPTALKGSSADNVHLALAEQQNSYLQATVEELRLRLEHMKTERDQAITDAREDRNRVMALLENQQPKSFWSRLLKR